MSRLRTALASWWHRNVCADAATSLLLSDTDVDLDRLYGEHQ
jgi:hypothetical protein